MPKTKNLILFYIFLSSCFVSVSQEITGTYHQIDQALVVAEVGVTYNFRGNGTFEKKLHEHLGHKTISGGEYTFQGDTLLLKYNNIGTNILIETKIKTKKRLNSSGILNSEIRVFNSKGDPQAGVSLLMQNKEKKLVMGFSSDKEGRFPPISIHDRYIQYFTLSTLAHREATINTDSLFGYGTDIEVYLSDSTLAYLNKVKTLKFLIVNRTEESLELQPLNGLSTSILKLQKINKDQWN